MCVKTNLVSLLFILVLCTQAIIFDLNADEAAGYSLVSNHQGWGYWDSPFNYHYDTDIGNIVIRTHTYFHVVLLSEVLSCIF